MLQHCAGLLCWDDLTFGPGVLDEVLDLLRLRELVELLDRRIILRALTDDEDVRVGVVDRALDENAVLLR